LQPKETTVTVLEPLPKIMIAAGAAYLDFSVVNVRYLKSLKVSKMLDESDATYVYFTQKEDYVNDVGELEFEILLDTRYTSGNAITSNVPVRYSKVRNNIVSLFAVGTPLFMHTIVF
jgi:hypothetical protein